MLKGRPMSIKFIYRSKLKPLSVPSLLSLVTLFDLSRKLVLLCFPVSSPIIEHIS